MKNLSRFDLIMIISFVVIGLLGAGGWYYLSGELDAAKQDVGNANSDFEKYSKNFVYLPDQRNASILKGNIELLRSQFEPVIKNVLKNPDNKLATAVQKDTVAWKHDLDDEVRRLTAAAKAHGVDIPPKYYFSFARYLAQAPAEEQTAVLSKQLFMVEQFSTIIINAPVKKITGIRRTYEEDGDAGGGANAKDGDMLAGHSAISAAKTYTTYPFEVEFDGGTDSLRKVINGFQQSPYVIVIRSLAVQNTQKNSPQIGDLDRMAGTQDASVVNSSPGEVAATKSTAGPQYLFGSESIHVRLRFDVIEWTAVLPPSTGASSTSGSGSQSSASSGGSQ